jgi:hypothetical protein
MSEGKVPLLSIKPSLAEVRIEMRFRTQTIECLLLNMTNVSCYIEILSWLTTNRTKCCTVVIDLAQMSKGK